MSHLRALVTGCNSLNQRGACVEDLTTEALGKATTDESTKLRGPVKTLGQSDMRCFDMSSIKGQCAEHSVISTNLVISLIRVFVGQLRIA